MWYSGKKPHRADYGPFVGNWRMPEGVRYLYIQKIVHLLVDDNLRIVPFSEIAWKGKHHFPYGSGDQCPCCNGSKFRNCDPKYPGIIIENAPNPYNNRYRMVDGRHRVQRLMVDGLTEGCFHVLQCEDVKQFFQESEDY